MAGPARLDDDELVAALASLPEWVRNGDRIVRELRFGSFADAVAFMQSLVPAVDELDHHPEWTNVYNRLIVELTTHDSGGLTRLDIQLAAVIDAAYDATS